MAPVVLGSPGAGNWDNLFRYDPLAPRRGGDRFARAAAFAAARIDVEHGGGLREHRDVGCSSPRRTWRPCASRRSVPARVDRAILGGHDGPARLRPPGDAVVLLREKIERRREVGRVDDPLLLGERSPAKHATPSRRIQTRPSRLART